MNLASLSIKRPTFIMSIVMVILVVGAVSFMKLKVDRFPNVNFPVIVVMTQYPGAGPNEVETQVSKPLEEQLASVSGIRHISSMNYDSMSVVVVEFEMSGDIKDLEQQSRAKVAMARAKMPDGIEEPIIRRADPSDAPIIIAAVSGDLSQRDLHALADKEIKEAIQQVDGVSYVDVMGGAKREIQVLLDRQKLLDHQVTVTAVAGRIGGSSMNIPIGKVDRGSRELSFRTLGEYNTLEQVRRVPVNFIGSDIPVTVGDLGEVVDGTQDMTGYAYYNRKPAVFMMIYRQSGANTVKAADDTKAAILKLDKGLKDRLGKPHISLVVDLSKEIRMNLNDVKWTIIEGIFLAILVVYLFLGSARSTFITTIALPNSLLGSFILMSLMGFTINMITLMALSLAVGLLIDDAIVVRENIWRHMERGEEPRDAAIRGTREVTMAVIATTLTIISVFLPIGFLSGMMGQFFRELGLTIVFAMAISFFDAMTTAPLLSAYMIKKTGNGKKINGRNGHGVAGACRKGWEWACWIPKKAAAATHRFQLWLVDRYEGVIRWSLRHRPLILTGAVVILILSFVMLKSLKTEFMPPAGTGAYQISLEMAPGTAIDATMARSKEIEQIVRSRKENRNVSMLVGGSGYGGGGNMATFFIEMSSDKGGRISTVEMKEVMRKKLSGYKDCVIKVLDMQVMHTGAQAAFNMMVKGDNLETILAVAEKAKREFAKIPDLVELDLDSRSGAPEMRFQLEPEKMAALGASTIAVGTELRYMVDGSIAAQFRDQDDEYNIRVFLKKDQRDLKADLASVRVPNNNYNMVNLTDLSTPVTAASYTKITRRDRGRYINVMGNIGPKGTLGSVQGAAEKIMKKMDLPKGITYQFWGTSEYFEEMVTNMGIAMALAVIFMYLILASLYESLVMPLLIMLALPFAFIGAFIALRITDQNLTMFALIGLVMLLGLVAKNSILLVDYAMQMTRKGMNRDDAVIRAGKVRLRPILMTTIALIAGMSPLALALTEVGKFRQSMGVTIIGGLISSLFLTLIVIPSMFGWFDGFRRWSRRLLGRPEDREIDRVDRESRLPEGARTPKQKAHIFN